MYHLQLIYLGHFETQPYNNENVDGPMDLNVTGPLTLQQTYQDNGIKKSRHNLAQS